MPLIAAPIRYGATSTFHSSPAVCADPCVTDAATTTATMTHRRSRLHPRHSGQDIGTGGHTLRSIHRSYNALQLGARRDETLASDRRPQCQNYVEGEACFQDVANRSNGKRRSNVIWIVVNGEKYDFC